LRVVPEFGAFYAQFDRELPLSTRMIVAVSNFARGYFPFILLAVVGAVVGLWMWFRHPAQRALLDRWLLKLPGIGPIARKFSTSQASRTLATLLGGGIPLVNAIDVSAKSIKNRYIARELEVAGQKVREGRALAAAMNESGAFADVAIKMVEVGESTGALQEMLNSLADFFDEEIDTNLSRFITLVEPLMLVVMGIVIAGLLLALYMPLFNMGGLS
jgi:type IV pilus assembly protein PilC